MRILHVSSLWEPVAHGGAELYAARLAAEQRAAGHTVGVITHGITGPDVVESVPAWPFRVDQHDGQPAWRRGAFRAADVYNPVAARRIRKAVRRFAPDIVHSHNVVGLSTAALTGGGYRIAHVHHVHDYWLLCRRTTMRLPNGEICNDRTCRAITAARGRLLRRHPPQLLLTGSRASVEDHSRLDWARRRLRHVPLTIGVEFEVPREARRGGGEPITFGYIGQLARTKGFDTLLRAFDGLEGGHRLVVAGTGELAEAAMSAGPRVTALGWIDEEAKRGFYDEIDCLVVPSVVPETGPIVVLESRARGVPIVGARIGGIPETVGARCSPLLFGPGNAGELRAALERFAEDPRRYVLRPGETPDRIGLSWSDHADSVMALYQEAIELAAT